MYDIRNEEDITTLVYAFYAKVVEDERLGTIFNKAADLDWDEHLPKIVDFWSKVLFPTERYKGRPFGKHLTLPIEPKDFRRWVSLFVETVDEHFGGHRVDYAKELAVNIANSFNTRMAMGGTFDQEK